MIYEIPPTVFDTLRGRVIYRQSVGKKCVVSWLPCQEGTWVEAGHRALDGAGCIEDTFARLYIRGLDHGETIEVRTVLPKDTPFRSSLRGRKSNSKSFDKAGKPVRQVRLLYALKTGRYEDRFDAICACWESPSEPSELDMTAQETDAECPIRFRALVGREMALSASQPGGLSDWLLWEKVADAAAAFILMRADQKRELTRDQTLLLNAVKDTAKIFGIPPQFEVRTQWEKLGGQGEWRDALKSTGFEWLPSKRDWEKHWRTPLLERPSGV